MSEWMAKITTHKTGAFWQSGDEIQHARCALVGAKAANVIHFKVPKLTRSDVRKKKRDLMKAVKGSIETIGVREEFPTEALAALSSL